MLDSYNQINNKRMDLVIFNYVLEHVSRISRILKQPFGHALLIGVGGSGRQSATKLAAHISEYRLFQLQLTKQYKKESWREVCFVDGGTFPTNTQHTISDSPFMNFH
jgi:dynein heavy chain, axonemal